MWVFIWGMVAIVTIIGLNVWAVYAYVDYLQRKRKLPHPTPTTPIPWKETERSLRNIYVATQIAKGLK